MNKTTEPSPLLAVRSNDGLGALKPWKLLSPKPDTCQECASKHEPELPHNQQSLFWQYNFYNKNGRWPTWKDAMVHCTPSMQEQWIIELAKYGITVDDA